jgi:hypothetical protein
MYVRNDARLGDVYRMSIMKDEMDLVGLETEKPELFDFLTEQWKEWDRFVESDEGFKFMVEKVKEFHEKHGRFPEAMID